MKLTDFLKLKKPDPTDYVNVQDLNDNFDALDTNFKTMDTNVNDLDVETSRGIKLFTGEEEPIDAKVGDIWLREV